MRYNDPTHYVANKNFKNTFTLDGETYTQIGTSNKYSYNGKEYGILSRATTNQIGRTISMYLSDGTNSEDLNHFRPGLRALKELSVFSPLAEAGMTKKDIRQYSAELHLPTA